MSDGPSFKSDLLGSATLTIFGRPIREVRVARPLVRRDRLGAHDRGDVELQVRRDATGTNAVASGGAECHRHDAPPIVRTTCARLIWRAPIPLSRVSECRIGESSAPLRSPRALVVAERSDVGGGSAARVRLLGSACTSRSFGPRAPGVDASAARAAARRSVWSPRAGWTFDGHRLPRPPSVDPRARRVDPATGRGHAVERGRSPHAAPRWRPGPSQTDDRPRRGTRTGCRGLAPAVRCDQRHGTRRRSLRRRLLERSARRARGRRLRWRRPDGPCRSPPAHVSLERHASGGGPDETTRRRVTCEEPGACP